MIKYGNPYNWINIMRCGRMADKSKGLIIAFHGLGGSPNQLMENSQLDEVGWKSDCSVVFIQSLWRFWRFWGPTTNWHLRRDLQTIQHILDTTPYDTTRLYAAGFSAGGNFCIRIADLLRDKLAGVIVYAGQFKVVKEIPAGHPLPKLLSIGNDKDGMVPFDENAKPLSRWWKEINPNGLALMQGKGGHEWDKSLNPFIAEWIKVGRTE